MAIENRGPSLLETVRDLLGVTRTLYGLSRNGPVRSPRGSTRAFGRDRQHYRQALDLAKCEPRDDGAEGDLDVAEKATVALGEFVTETMPGMATTVDATAAAVKAARFR